VIVDLHTHSRASDGTQTPTELVRAAAEAGVDVLGLTDHDTADGWAEAAAAAQTYDVGLVRGMEISTRHRGGRGVHLLAYLPDPTYEPLREELRRVLDGRSGRVPAMVERLRAEGIGVTEEDVRRAGDGTAATGRPHVADALVALGVVRDRTEAFDRWLKPGRPAYVDRYAAPLEEMIGTVAAAGGVTVVAHPWGRYPAESLDAAAIAELATLGLAGLEVDHQDHTPEKRAGLRAIARELDLVVTGSSDHHGLGKVDHELGVNTTAPEELERLLARAAEAGARSGRDVPGLLAAQ
jgi:3',5'-nucleoside bisphosphate phosphatase